MNTYFWHRWAELDQLVRQLTLLHPPLLRKLADAPPNAIHAVAIHLRATSWGQLCAKSTSGRSTNLQDVSIIGTLRDNANAEALSALAHHVCSANYDRLIAAKFPSAPANFLRALNRCGNDVHPPEFYEQLVNGLSRTESLALLCNMTGKIELRDLTQIEQACRLDPIVHAAFCRRRISLPLATALDRILHAVRHFHGTNYDNAFVDTLAAWNDQDRHRHVHRLLDRLPGAPPPWAGDDMLVPIQRPRALSRIARRFKNCLSHSRLEHIFGQVTFYEWQSPELPAIVALRHSAPFGWEIDEIKGMRNIGVPATLRSEIKVRIAAVGFCTSISAHRAIGYMRREFFLDGEEI